MHSQSEQVGELITALAKAQGQFGKPKMTAVAKISSDRANYSYKYAPLDEGFDAVRKPLSDNGLAITQRPYEDRSNGTRYMLVETRLWYGEQFIGMDYPVANITAIFENEKFDPKKLAAMVSYAKRYSLFALLGLAGEEDVDGDALPTDIGGNGKRGAADTKPILGEEANKLRDNLIAQIGDLHSPNDFMAFARDSRAIKNRLPATHQRDIDAAFSKAQEEAA